MKKREVDHVLRAAGRITHEKQFIIVGSQALHGKYPDLADDIVRSAEVDLFAKNHPEKTDSLNVIGVYSTFHEQYGYYADPVDERPQHFRRAGADDSSPYRQATQMASSVCAWTHMIWP